MPSAIVLAATILLVVLATDSHAFAPERGRGGVVLNTVISSSSSSLSSSTTARIHSNNNLNDSWRQHIISSSLCLSASSPSSPNEEDLELTRQIIMAHIKKMGLEDGDDDDNEDDENGLNNNNIDDDNCHYYNYKNNY
jgi:hypothetical protein